MKGQKWAALVACLVAMVLLTLTGAAMAEKGETGEKAKVAVSEATGPMVNINTATVEELATLTGVGKEIAQRIVEYRQANGLFKNIEQLKNVKGIGDKILEKNMGRLTVGNLAK
ncbi:MAG: ComEA family DNA-binding protein [Thermodesulfobacteriota bacterium]